MNTENLFKIHTLTENFWRNQDDFYYIATSLLQTSDEYLNLHSFLRNKTTSNTMNNTRFTLFTGMIVAAALSRILPHPPNFAPINAIALFAGAYLADRKLFAFAVPLCAMLLSDTVLEMLTGWGFHSGMWVVYGTMTLITVLGLRFIQKPSLLTVGATTLAASVLFFVLTNCAVWASSGMYAHTFAGLQTCFVAALPFFQNSLLGDMFYSTVLFGSVALAERFIPALKPIKI